MGQERLIAEICHLTNLELRNKGLSTCRARSLPLPLWGWTKCTDPGVNIKAEEQGGCLGAPERQDLSEAPTSGCMIPPHCISHSCSRLLALNSPGGREGSVQLSLGCWDPRHQETQVGDTPGSRCLVVYLRIDLDLAETDFSFLSPSWGPTPTQHLLHPKPAI